jgi:hypothetical protein
MTVRDRTPIAISQKAIEHLVGIFKPFISVMGAGMTQETRQQVGVPNGFRTKAEDYRRSGMARLICLLASFAGYSRIHR